MTDLKQRILAVLRAHPYEVLRLGEIAEAVGELPQAIRPSLRALKRDGLAETYRFPNVRWIYWRSS